MHFTVLLIAIFGFAIYLGNFGQVKEVNLKEGKVIISEFKNISEDLVGVIAYNISTTGRFAPDDLEKRVVESRELIKSYLKKIGSKPEKISEILKPFQKHYRTSNFPYFPALNCFSP